MSSRWTARQNQTSQPGGSVNNRGVLHGTTYIYVESTMEPPERQGCNERQPSSLSRISSLGPIWLSGPSFLTRPLALELLGELGLG